MEQPLEQPNSYAYDDEYEQGPMPYDEEVDTDKGEVLDLYRKQ